MVRVLFVCMGNICRSPTAEAVFTSLVEQNDFADMIAIDSAGTHDYHIGDKPDRRSQKAAENRGFEMSHLRARQVQEHDFEVFDYVVAMDQTNLDHLIAIAPVEHHEKISLLLVHNEATKQDEVPDPYYGGLSGFDDVLDLVTEGASALLDKIKQDHKL